MQNIRPSDIEKFGRTVAKYLIGIGCLDESYHEICNDFIHKVCDNIELIKPAELDEQILWQIIGGTVIGEVLFNHLFEKIPEESLEMFAKTWTELLFTDELGDTIEEMQENLEVFMEGLHKKRNVMCNPCIKHLEPDTREQEYINNDVLVVKEAL